MKNKMISLAAALLLMISLATARSLSNKNDVMDKKLVVTRREAGNMSALSPNLTEHEADLANLSIPIYLRNLYINLTYLNGNNSLDKKINTVRSYETQATNAKCGYVKFNMDGNTVGNEEIISVELHLLQNDSAELPNHYNVHINFLLSENDTTSPLKATFKHIDSTPGWKKFDITSLAIRWIKGWRNHGLQVRVTKGEKVLPCDKVFPKKQDMQDSWPSLVVFTYDSNSRLLHRILKNKPTTSDVKTQQKRNTRKVTCHLKKFVVTADSLNSTDVQILLPKSFDAGICEGHCTKLQLTSKNDYSYILSLYYLNNVKVNEVPSKCCVPYGYNKVHMLFYDTSKREHILKKDVAVKANSCICL